MTFYFIFLKKMLEVYYQDFKYNNLILRQLHNQNPIC